MGTRQTEKKARAEDRGHHKRSRLVIAVILALFTAIAVQLIHIQVLNAEKYRKIAAIQRMEEVEIEAKRGKILDRNGNCLAYSKEMATIYATPYLVKNKEEASSALSEILDIEETVILEKLNRKTGFVYLERKVEKPIGDAIKEMRIDGIGVIPESMRVYPKGATASTVIGIVDIDNNGLTGIEHYYDETMKGTNGRMSMEKDPSGQPIPNSEYQYTAPVNGSDIVLTIDESIQYEAERALEEAVSKTGSEGGSLVMLDCSSGEIIAVASAPSFNPLSYTEEDIPNMRCRAITDTFEPGSVCKIVTAAAALNEGIFSPETHLNIPKQLPIADAVFRDSHELPSSLTFTDVIAYSSNVGTIQIAREIGKEKLYEYYRGFGFGELTGVDYPGEVTGVIPSPEAWSATSIGTIPIGQGMSATNLQLCVMAAIVANGGNKVEPHLMKKVSDGNEEAGKERSDDSRLNEGVLSSESSELLKEILKKAVEDGTGEEALIPLYTTAGKTGTAMIPSPKGGYIQNAYQATFVGFAPVESPRYAMSVTLTKPQTSIYGGAVAAPVFSQAMEFALRNMVPAQAAAVIVREGEQP